MGNLYRVLKGKVEGGNPKAKSANGRKSSGSSSGSGGKGMADALAEMTKRSSYFQQIEEDIQKYSNSILELKTAISNFNTKDMTELIEFHKKVESVLEKLTDETQVTLTEKLVHVKGELDALERTKDDEAKKFQSQNIHFDFHVLVQIKEAMVDVSSNCMELALKERRETKGESNIANTKLLWRAFQFAFRVYSFAGGHDERADRLTRELAHEIETDSQHK
ncbi:hypothetical protein JCGZ_21401 [Jatropha curcas]|uniref:Uncharacterized protein n=1 Tax=Jatropha curcas TaxID=180498 RepID=A0A067JLN7_JATCU|nr:hypothetical protein JCGZ_21401 [Jatropha curcas]